MLCNKCGWRWYKGPYNELPLFFGRQSVLPVKIQFNCPDIDSVHSPYELLVGRLDTRLPKSKKVEVAKTRHPFSFHSYLQAPIGWIALRRAIAAFNYFSLSEMQ